MKITRLILITLIITILILSGCGKKSSEESIEITRKDIAPEELKNIYKNMVKIVQTVEKPEKTNEGNDEKNKENDEENKEESDGGENNKENSRENNKENGENKEAKENENNETDIVEVLEKNIKQMHKSWNKYEREGIKKGATEENINNFRQSLDELTITIENRQISNIGASASKVFLSLSPFFDLYKDELYGEICLIKHYVYESYIAALEGRIFEGDKFLTLGKNNVNRLNAKLEDDKKKTKNIELLEGSIEDMRFSLKSRNKNLLKIKKDIIIENLEEITH